MSINKVLYIYNSDEIRFIRHRYKVMTLLVSARKIHNNNNKIQQQQRKKRTE